MKKKQVAALALAAGAGAWCIRRGRKYPVRRELRFANKLVCPGWAINLGTARLSNRLLDWMPLPTPPQGVKSWGTQVFSEDGTPVRLTRYRPVGLDWAAPCLVYFHGGGSCVRDAGYIHRYAARYPERAQCKVGFVHYRTSDIAPFPTPFEDCCATLCRVWDNASKLQIDRTRIAVGGDSAGGALAAVQAAIANPQFLGTWKKVLKTARIA